MLHICFSFTFSILAILFFYLLNISISKARLKHSKLPPGSFCWYPLLGKTLSFLIPHRSCYISKFLEDNIKRHGRIFRTHLFGRPTIVSCDVEFNSFILQNENRLLEAAYPYNIPKVLGELTLLAVTGSMHKRLRGFTLNLFGSVKIPQGQFLSDIEDSILKVMDSWKDKKTLVFTAETRKVTFNVIVRQVLGLETDDPIAVEILQNLQAFMEGLVSMPINLPGTKFYKAIVARKRLHEVVKNITNQRYNRGKHNGRMDFLDVLMTQENISEEEITSVVADLLFGGYDTTSFFIATLVKFLSENSDSKILRDLREEHLSIRKSKNQGEKLGLDDYQKMKFTECVINETLRLGNVVKFVHRKSIKPIHYKGFEIPAGYYVFPIFSGVHFDPSLHEDPYKFDPYRWQKEDVTISKMLMAFGGGPRRCPGSELARVETSFFLHHFVLNYSWTPLVETDWPMNNPNLAFKNGFQIEIHPLEKGF